MDVYRHNMPGIIAWNIWKIYSQTTWGDLINIPSANLVINKIKFYAQEWYCSKLGSLKFKEKPHPTLLEEGFIPKTAKSFKPRITTVKWKVPEQKYKLNVDASFGSNQVAGGALLRSDRGELLRALHFPISARSALEAEPIAIIAAVSWMMEQGFREMEVESDSKGAIEAIKASNRSKGRIFACLDSDDW
ncbi:unnamed protein product, partial [Cuscuta epithymum]